MARPFPEDSLIDIVVGITVEMNEHGVPARLVPATDATLEQLALRAAWLRGGEAPPVIPATQGCVDGS